MKTFRRKERVEAEFIKGPFSSPGFVVDTQDGSENPDGTVPVEFPQGCYLVVEGGKGKYLDKVEFEQTYEPTKVKKMQQASTLNPREPKKPATKKKEEKVLDKVG